MGKAELDLEGYAASKGGRVTGYNNGIATIVTEDGKEGEIDVNSFAKANNVPLSDIDIKLNSPETAADDTALSMPQQLGFIMAGNAKQRKQYLESTFGADNVVMDGDSFKVKDANGMWKRGDSKWYADIAASAPNLAVGIAAGAKAATATTAVTANPLLGALAGVTAGALASSLEKYGEQKFAEAAGIRTEQDLATTADEVGRDFANNMIWGVAGAAGGKVIQAINPFNKLKIANMLGSIVHGSKAEDWLTVMRSSQDANAVKAIVSDDVAAKAKNTLAELLPSTRKMSAVISDTLTGAKETAENMYDTGIKKLAASGALQYRDPKPIMSLRDSLAADLSEAGLVKIQAVGDKVSAAFKSSEELNTALTNILDNKSQDSLKRVFETVNRLAERPGSASLDEVLKVRKMIGSIRDDLGHFTAPAGSSGEAKRLLARTSTNLDSMFNAGLSKTNIVENGVSIPANEFFQNMNQKYSTFRQGYDVFADKIKDFSDKNAIAKVVGTLDKEAGHQYLNAYKTIANATDNKAMIGRIGELQQLIAGKNLASMSGGQGVTGVLRTATGMTGANVSSGVGTMKLTADQAKQGLSAILPVARASNFLRKLPVQQKLQMLSDGQATTKFLQAITDFSLTRQSTEEQLLQQVP